MNKRHTIGEIHGNKNGILYINLLYYIFILQNLIIGVRTTAFLFSLNK